MAAKAVHYRKFLDAVSPPLFFSPLLSVYNFVWVRFLPFCLCAALFSYLVLFLTVFLLCVSASLCAFLSPSHRAVSVYLFFLAFSLLSFFLACSLSLFLSSFSCNCLHNMYPLPLFSRKPLSFPLLCYGRIRKSLLSPVIFPFLSFCASLSLLLCIASVLSLFTLWFVVDAESKELERVLMP